MGLVPYVMVRAFKDALILSHNDKWLPKYVSREGSVSADATLKSIGLVRVRPWNYTFVEPLTYAARDGFRPETTFPAFDAQLQATKDLVEEVLLECGAGFGNSIHDDGCAAGCSCVADVAEEIAHQLLISDTSGHG